MSCLKAFVTFRSRTSLKNLWRSWFCCFARLRKKTARSFCTLVSVIDPLLWTSPFETQPATVNNVVLGAHFRCQFALQPFCHSSARSLLSALQLPLPTSWVLTPQATRLEYSRSLSRVVLYRSVPGGYQPVRWFVSGGGKDELCSYLFTSGLN